MAARAYRAARAQWHAVKGWPLVRHWRNGALRRMAPLDGGRQRGTPVVRLYWEAFLERHRGDIRGVALEVGDSLTLRRLGGRAVTRADVIDVAAREGVTVVADLSKADHLPGESYDCFVAPFTAHHIYDLESALFHALRILKPGGVLLINFPCVDYYPPNGIDMGTGRPLHVFWWFTPLQVENLLRRAGLDAADFEIAVDGNLFTRIAYQLNMTAEELAHDERTYRDEGHPLLISVRARRPRDWQAARPPSRDAWLPSGDAQRWNSITGHYPLP